MQNEIIVTTSSLLDNLFHDPMFHSIFQFVVIEREQKVNKSVTFHRIVSAK